RRCFRRNCPQLSKRAHHALHAGLRPSVPIDSLHFMRRNQSDQVIVLHDDEAAASGAQQVFIDEVLQVQEALYGSAVTIHEIGNKAPAQSGHELHLDVAVAGKTPLQPQGRAIYVRSSSTLVFLASNMPAIPPQKTYELWLIPTSGAPIPAGLFTPDAHGSA